MVSVSRPSFFALSLFLLICTTATATTWYVSPEPGSPEDGTSWQRAFDDPDEALAQATSGDQVMVAGGVYTVPYPGGLQVPAGVLLFGGFAGNEGPDIMGGRRFGHETILDGGGAVSVLVLQLGESGTTILDGFTIQNAVCGVVFGFGDTSVSLTNNIIRNTTYGIDGDSCSANVFANYITANGVGFYAHSSFCHVHDNIFDDNTCGAICTDDVDSSEFTNNTVVYNDYGIYVQSDITIANSIIAHQYGPGITGYDEANATLLNNCLYSNSPDYDGVEDPGSPSIIADPQFTYGYHIAELSPCRDAGDPNSMFDNHDFDGGVRTGETVDIGALRYGGFSMETMAPTLAVTAPSGTTWYIDCRSGPVEIEGTAVDTGFSSGIATVKVDTGEGPHSALYDAGTHAWSYTWENQAPGTHTVTIRATDQAGNSSSLSFTAYVSGVVHVAPGGTGSGSSWASPLGTIQAAIDAAYNTVPKAEVWVKTTLGDDPYEENITLRDGVAVYGGFAGTEAGLEQRDWLTNVTTIDPGANGGTVVTASGVGTGTRFDGFTVTGGATDTYSTDGGGIYCEDASLIIANNVIASNQCHYYGGGICCIGGAPTIVDNEICANGAAGTGYGGGVYCSQSSALIEHNNIHDNAVQYGGGIYCDGASPQIIRNTLTRNFADEAGSGIYCSSATGCARISDNLFVLNGYDDQDSASEGSGGGVYITGDAVNNEQAPHVNNNTFWRNAAKYGGGAYITDAAPTFANNILAYNNTGIDYVNGTVDYVTHNDVFGSWVSDYSPGTPIAGNISADPLLDREDHCHIANNSPCVAAGDNSAVLTGETDIDGEGRRGPSTGNVDIGADELDVATCEFIKLAPDPAVCELGDQLVVTATVYDPETGDPIQGRRVDFTTTAGSIAAITPDQHLIDSSSGWGTTGSDGKVTVTLSSATMQGGTLTASATTECSSEISAACRIQFGHYHICLDYNLVWHPYGANADWAADTEEYLKAVAAAYPDVSYSRLNDLSLLPSGNCNVLFIVIPDWSVGLSSTDLAALQSFLGLGGHRRVVLVGEYAESFCTCNTVLNTATDWLGLYSTFDDTDEENYPRYDPWPNRDRLCVVNTHILTQGVEGLWDAATNTFQGWSGHANPIALVAQQDHSSEPWLVAEADSTCVLIHDASIFNRGYNDVYDTVPDKNFLFTYNLCTVFPE